MREDLRFVQGAVAKKDFVPELTHFQVVGGRVTAYNGHMALSSPIDIDLTARPKAIPFSRAIATGIEGEEGAITLHMTKAGRLAVKSGKFRAFVECLTDDTPMLEVFPEGEEIDVGENFLAAIKALAPFMGVDASRPWSSGIMFKGASAYATNNICLLEYWHGHGFPVSVNIPSVAVKEILRINKPPTKVRIQQGHSMSFYFEGDRWLRTAVLATEWPDSLPDLLAREGAPVDVPPELFDAIDTLKPFLTDRQYVYFRDGAVCTEPETGIGVEVEVAGIHNGPCFHHSQITLIRSVAKRVDFEAYPNPCKFDGDQLRGLIVGLRP